MSTWKYDSDEDYYESLSINHDDQEYDGDDDDFDPRECDRAAEIYEGFYLILSIVIGVSCPL
ncbi:hypothetical protein [Gallibacterium anatis]|uniref:hypothetical protein n=1 Tax=Gallibacterium anatis TaxID=750 RepID=UPI0039FBA6C5